MGLCALCQWCRSYITSQVSIRITLVSSDDLTPHNYLNPVRLKLRNIISNYDTFYSNLGINTNFTKYLKESG